MQSVTTGSTRKTTKVKTPRGLQQLLANDPSQALLYAVEAVQAKTSHMRLRRVIRKQNKRDSTVGWIHVTAALDDCDRGVAARLLGYPLPRKLEDPKGWRILENGNYMHLRWQNSFLQLPKKHYQVQVAVIYREWPLVGEADVWIDHEEFGPTIIELKSMNSNQFRGLKDMPRESHFYQANLYMGLSGTPSGQVWYENKDNQDVKTFFGLFDEEHYLTVRERVIAIANMVVRGGLPRACEQECDYDEYVGDIQLDEGRISQLAREMSEWQKLKRPA